MPKLKTHKGMKKRFKVSATGKVSHKRCGSSHLNSHKSGSKIRKLRRKKIMKVEAEAKRVRTAMRTKPGVSPAAVEQAREQAAFDNELAGTIEEAAREVEADGAAGAEA